MQNSTENIEGLGELHTMTLDPSSVPKDSVIIMDGSGKPKILPKARVFGAIPNRGGLVQMCTGCSRPPRDNEKEFSICSNCKWGRYCSKECQKRHWKQHKPECQERKAANERMKALEAQCIREGRPFYSPYTFKAWYRKHFNAVEYAAFHVLEVYKGAQSTYPPDKFAACFILVRDEKSPNDEIKIQFDRIHPIPRELATKMIPDSLWVRAIQLNMMVLWMMDSDMERMESGLVELHATPSKDGIKFDEHWKLQTMMALASPDKVDEALNRT